MKFPSISELWLSLLAVCKRFFLPILYTVCATTAALLLANSANDNPTEQILAKLIYLGNFGFVLSLAISLYAEVNPIAKARKIVFNCLVPAVLVIIYLSLDPAIYQADVFVLLAIAFACHLLVAFVAFIGSAQEIGFWQLNKTFFLRFATSALYSAVLFAGLSIALFSIHTLFDVKWNGEVYLSLWIFIVGIFNTVFFLAGIPKPLVALNITYEYPKALKVFTQYVLIPLASIYLLILLAYEVKIILEWSLPNSSVAILILGYSVFGILSILLVHPIRNNEGNKWIQLYSKSFYLFMLPLLALLAVAIGKRVSDYGITESRYLLITLSVWLTFITIYFLIKGREHIRIVPVSLFVFAVFISFGPWGVKQVSLKSQSNRLAHHIALKPSQKRDDEIRSLVRYLSDDYGSASLQQFVKIDLQGIENEIRKKPKPQQAVAWEVRQNIADTVLRTLNVSLFASPQLLDRQQKNYVNSSKGVVSVSGAIKLIPVNSNMSAGDADKIAFSMGDETFTVAVDKTQNLTLTAEDGTKAIFRVDGLLKSLQNNKSLKANTKKPDILSVVKEGLSLKSKVKGYTFELVLEELTAFYPQKTIAKPANIYFYGYLIVYPNL